MANYFTHFSCLLDVGTPENAAHALDLYNALSEENAAEDPPSEGFLLSIQPEHGGTQLWIRDDETGDPEHVIQFIKRCAAAFRLTGCSRCDPARKPLISAPTSTPGCWSPVPVCAC